jgi:hypothetical protein
MKIQERWGMWGSADIDGDGLEKIDPWDSPEVSGDESVVFTLPNKFMTKGSKIQLFDHVVQLVNVYGFPGLTAQFYVYPNEDASPAVPTPDNLVTLYPNQVKYFYRGVEHAQQHPAERPTFYLKLITADADTDEAVVEVGRLFGEVDGTACPENEFWSQKAFMVDDVFYNVVAIKGELNCFKYITFRQKLPKTPIKLYGNDLKVWVRGMTLAEMSPFNEPHEICVDIASTWSRPSSEYDKIGAKKLVGPLTITFVAEDVERRFKGELKEIYFDTSVHQRFATTIDATPTPMPVQQEMEFWLIEWFYTQPWQYTSFVLPKDQLYLVTLAWYAPEAEWIGWDGGSVIARPDPGARVKFWYDPNDNTDIYVNRFGPAPTPPEIDELYDMATYGGNGNGEIDLEELAYAILDFSHNAGPFAPDGQFVRVHLIGYLMDFLRQEGYIS